VELFVSFNQIHTDKNNNEVNKKTIVTSGVSITTIDEVLVDASADIVLLIGYMRILSKSFCDSSIVAS
jgi:folate-dependent phosphoribosylglycinamide formyltransferase PurN